VCIVHRGRFLYDCSSQIIARNFLSYSIATRGIDIIFCDMILQSNMLAVCQIGAVNLRNYIVKIAPNPSMKSLVIAIEYSVKLTAPSNCIDCCRYYSLNN
jgi:hypothetical protein